MRAQHDYHVMRNVSLESLLLKSMTGRVCTSVSIKQKTTGTQQRSVYTNLQVWRLLSKKIRLNCQNLRLMSSMRLHTEKQDNGTSSVF